MRNSRSTTLRMLAVVAAVGTIASLPAGASAAAPARPTVAPAVAPALAPAAPAGHLPAGGCVQTPGAEACDLYAMTGTATVLGTPVPIWGFSTTGAANSATAPGPALVVQQGESITITLHNQIAGQVVSLALPGQAPHAFNGVAGDDTTGVAAGLTATYTFTADRPGTFLYEAGHTNNGSRQVAMGLAGALIVLPSDGTAYGSPATAYDDDGLVVLSEIDPALNAAPSTFDMRNFKPKYRLINGKPFPASDEISTDQGHTVLVRYVNVGSETHTMTTLGADQTQVASGGHPLTYAEPLVVQTVEPGATDDTLVHMPTGPESKIALYDAAEHLDNNAQTTADPLQFAFGGLLTFLDTAAPAPSSDGVGPVSSHIAVSPNPSDGLSPVTVTADLSDATTGGSTVTQAEFVIDDAVTTGAGFGTPMTGAFGTVDVAGATGTISVATLAGLDAGKHSIYVRALDSAGNWGVIGSAIFNLPKTGPQTTAGTLAVVPANGSADVTVSATGDDSAAGGTITDAEYFIDTVGANGTGTALTLNRVAKIVSEDGLIPASVVHGLSESVLHHVFVHSRDSLGLWGPTLDLALPVDVTGPAVDAASVGPNPTNGLISDKGNPGYLVVSASISDKDAGGAVQNTIADAEAFLDPGAANPPNGSGLQLIPVDGSLDSSTESVYGLIPLSQVRPLTNGVHQVYVRGQDSAGNWGPLFPVNLIVDKVAPVLGALVLSPNPTNGAANLTVTAPVTDTSLIAAVEYWFGTTDPGVGLGSSVPVSVASGNVTAVVPLAGVTAGAQQVNLRVKDLAGNWSNVRSGTVTVVRPNPIFSDAFSGPTLLPPWSAVTGGVSLSTLAGIPSGSGLKVTLPGGATNRVSYLTDNTPLNETTYHASFSFNRNTLTSGSNAATVLTLFDGRNAANGAVFSLQYHLTGGNVQVRTVLSRTGAAAVNGAWVTLTTGAHTLRVDWTSGPAFGGGAGSLQLSVDGTSRSLQNGNTSGLRVDSVRLGVVAGVTTTATGSTAGTAYFDNFVSTRNTLP